MVLNAGEIAHGATLAVEAAQFVIRHKRVQKKFVSVLKVTVIGMVLAYALIYVLLVLPLFIVRNGNYILATLLQYDATSSTFALLSTRDAVDHFLSTLPLLGLDIMVHVRPNMFEDIFFTMLEEVDPEYAKALKSWPPRKFCWEKVKFAARRLAKRYFMTLVASYLSRLPVVGWMVVPLGALTMMAKFVGYPLSGAIVLATVISPGSRKSTMFIFKSLLAMSDFSRDLMRPYFSHLGAKPKQQIQFYKTNESTVVGFILAYYLFVQLSWIGPAFYILAQAAIAMFISRQTVRPPPYTPAPEPTISQTSSRSTKIELEYAFSAPIFVTTKGIRTTNVRVAKAADTRWGSDVHVEVIVSSLSTTLYERVHAKSLVSERNECELCIEVDWSIWDIGLTNAEVCITLPASSEEPNVHPGIRVDIPSGALGVTMMGSTKFRLLDLSTGHGPAHLSDVAADNIKLAAHNGNITLHDIEAAGTVDIVGKSAWMDIDDLHAKNL
ncbi:hypothetical protein FB639_004126, partial [Coemansia asiatica]